MSKLALVTGAPSGVDAISHADLAARYGVA